MYFPQNSCEIDNFLKHLKQYPLHQQIELLKEAIQASSQRGLFPISREISTELLEKYLDELVVANEDRQMRNKERLQYLEYKLEEVLAKNESLQFIISTGVKSYKGLYIFLLSHPKNGTTSSSEILSRINYLDKMTRDVTFVMPGYDRAKENEGVVNTSDKNLQLTFDENIFINIVQKLEDQSRGRFQYKDECELVFIGLNTDGQFDFDNFQRLNLELLSKKRGIDPIKLIITVAQRFRANDESSIVLNKFVNQILGELALQDEHETKKVFIAGAKRMQEQRALLREELNKIENSLNVDIRSLTFEDFATSLTGKEKGRQADYNKFIREEADVVIFIFDTTAGEITEEEFDIAYTSLVENNRPDIYVYVRKRNYILNILRIDQRLENIKDKVFGYNQEYYVEYNNLDNLRYLFHRDMTEYFETSK